MGYGFLPTFRLDFLPRGYLSAARTIESPEAKKVSKKEEAASGSRSSSDKISPMRPDPDGSIEKFSEAKPEWRDLSKWSSAH